MKFETNDTNSDVTARVPADRQITTLEVHLGPSRRQFGGLVVFAAILLLIYSSPLLKLILFVLHTDLYSHILLIPFVSGYLIWVGRGKLRVESRPSPGMAALSAAAGGLVLGGYRLAAWYGWSLAMPDYLAAMVLSFLLFVFAGGLIFLGARYLQNVALPVAFLFFCIPFPVVLRRAIESFFQHGSADTAYVMFKLSGMPVLREGTFFQLPGCPLDVAPECSGIHSSLVLVITSLVAAHLFLRKTWHRWVLVSAVILLGLLRNGFRIFVIGQLCVRCGPQMIDSPIHRRGGPIFFLLALIPLFLLLRYLNMRELREIQRGKLSA